MTIRLLLVDDHSVVRQGLRLFLKYDPDKSHVSRILSKLGVQSRTQAALYAIRTGLVSPGSVEQPE
jgi:DNA-binding NarL/FixJ family response regulator